ncbi:MAG: Ig-like domain-containing protein [Anaerolineae bacterium]|nr:Ig-like domain-containing protein [Anaerolineae bacterium]
MSKLKSLKTNNLKLVLCLNILIALALACGLPGSGGLTGTPAGGATTESLQPRPPALVESAPMAGSEIPLAGPLTFYFNQPMDKASVEAALDRQPGWLGNMDWLDDSTLVFTPQSPWEPESELAVLLDVSVRAANGLAMLEPIELNFVTAGYLKLAHNLPESGAEEIDPTSAIVANFTRPVVALGAALESLPDAFVIEPSPPGRGEWLNTSTYIFYPDPGLEGGKTYSVSLNPGLVSTDQLPLEEAVTWTFSTANPRLVSVQPSADSRVWLDAEFAMAFNQPMDKTSVESYFSLRDPSGQEVPGKVEWNEDASEMVFVPANQLQRNTTYSLFLDGRAQGRGGTPLGAGHQSQLVTVAELAVLSSLPPRGGETSPDGRVALTMTAPVKNGDLSDFISIEPAVGQLRFFRNGLTLQIRGNFEPETDYTLILRPDLPDLWGGTLGEKYVLPFRTGRLDPKFSIDAFFGGGVLYISPQNPYVTAQAVNIERADLAVGSVPMPSFFSMMGSGGYDARRNFNPQDLRQWSQPLNLTSNRSQAVNLPLTFKNQKLKPGIYWVSVNSLPAERFPPQPFFVVASDVHLTFKISATDVFVWAVDRRSNTPVVGRNIAIYNEAGMKLVSGETDSDGVFHANIPAQKYTGDLFYAVLGSLGDEFFSLAPSVWEDGLRGWDFGFSTNFSPPLTQAYLYTDRPIYRPGDTLNFRGVVRQAYNGRYSIADKQSLPVIVFDDNGRELDKISSPVSTFGTIQGSYTLSADASPGYYMLAVGEEGFDGSIHFQVAEYRKPEIDLSIELSEEQLRGGQTLHATVNARFFFDAPAGNASLSWNLFARPSSFYLPGAQVGPVSIDWMRSSFAYGGIYGELVESGEGRTKADGTFSIDVPVGAAANIQLYELEVTIKDESGFPVSARAAATIHPDDYYIGVSADTWVGQEGTPVNFDVQVVDWDKNPAGERSLSASFSSVTWVPGETDDFGFTTYVREYTLVSSADLNTDENGLAGLSFTPPHAGIYQIEISGGDTLSQALVWVGGPGQAVWPNLPDNRLKLTADRESYTPGQTAQVFVPNPFGADTRVLVTIERSNVLSHHFVTMQGAGTNLTIPLTNEAAPNVYVSVTLLGKGDSGNLEYRQGYVNLKVDPVEFRLNVELVGEPQRAGPGDEVSFDLRVTDSQGNPVQGEFSLAVVDQAVLALADPNSLDIEPAFYGVQPLGVRTNIALSASPDRYYLQPLGRGGGGGGPGNVPHLREDFKDTAYWNAEIVTDANGMAQVSVRLPDNLTTWQVEVRGVTADTRVGQGLSEVITTKELLVRPVTPRFFVAGDHVLLVAIVHNNTSKPLDVGVLLRATGFTFDDPATAIQKVSLPAGGRERVAWWGTIQDVDNVELIFAAEGGGLQDLTRPQTGEIPVLHYYAPQTFSTAGVLDQGSQRIEVVSLPRTFDPASGGLTIELSPSLAAAMLDGLDALEHFPYECTEQTVSRFLPNLEAYRAIQEFGLDAPVLELRLERTLNDGLLRLLTRQNYDGGWGWWVGNQSDPYVTSYVVFGLSRAKAAGISVDENMMEKGVEFLTAGLVSAHSLSQTWQLDRLAFQQYVLAQAGVYTGFGASSLYEKRDQLNPWGQAFLALTLEENIPGDERAGTMISDLQATALRSASGAHWEQRSTDAQNMSSPIFNSAVVVYALAQRDPGSALLPDAVRYLMFHRQADGGWYSSYASAWTLMALTATMSGTGELGGDFAFSASLNEERIASGQAGGASQLTPVSTFVGLEGLLSGASNLLTIQRDPGVGRLYYRASLQVSQPVEMVGAMARGMSVARAYYAAGKECLSGDCRALSSTSANSIVTARVTLTLPHDAYYVVVEDHIPAGTEILDISLKTTQQGYPQDIQPDYDPRDPFKNGWGWWFFNQPKIRDKSISWTANYLPAGTYELVYTLVIVHPGEYRVLPARAWQFYFPEVQGSSAGALFEILPES